MKAAILRAFNTPLVIEELPDPQPGAGEAVVEVVAAPVISYTNEVLSGARQYPLLLPLAPGVGAIGRVRAVGPDATRLQPGDWVLCDPTVRARDEAVAPDIMLQGLIAPSPGAQRLQAHFRHGAFAEQILLPLENALPLGPLAAAEAGRLAAAMSTMLVPYGGLLAAGLRAGETVLISGATGHYGSAGVAVALAMGAGHVVAPGRNEAVLAELVRRHGPRVVPVVLSGDPTTDTARMQQAAGPIDKVLDILPPLPDAAPVQAAVMAVRPRGTVVLMGGLRLGLTLNYAHLMRHCITVMGQYMYSPDAPARLLALVRAGLLPLEGLDVRSFPLGQANEAVAYAATTSPFGYTVLAP